MLFKIILKNFKANQKKYGFIMICNIFTMALLFVGCSLQEVFYDTSSEMKLLSLDLGNDYFFVSIILTAITVLMMFYSLKTYIKYRIKDYSMLLTLGMRKKKFLFLMSMEYILSWLFSFVLALMLGNGLIYLIIKILNTYAVFEIRYEVISGAVYSRTFLISFVLMVIVYCVMIFWMEGRNLGELNLQTDKVEKRPQNKWWALMTILGILICFFACHQYLSSWIYRLGAHFWWILSASLILISGAALLLAWIKKQEFYYKVILKLNGLYSRYVNNISFVIILFAIHFFVLGYVGNSIAARFPLEQDASVYPYDFIWIAKEKEALYAEALAETYDSDIEKIAMIRVVFDLDELIGISVTDYNRLTGSEMKLSEKEVLISVPSRKTYERRIKNVNIEEAYLYPGKYTDEQYERIVRENVSGNYAEECTFIIKNQILENLFGDYSQSVFPNTSIDGIMHESVIVFSEVWFENNYDRFNQNEEEPSVLYLIKTKENAREAVGNELQKYNTQNGILDELAQSSSPDAWPYKTLYDTEKIIDTIARNNLFFLMFEIIVGIDLFFCGLMIFGVKLFSDYDSYKRRYGLLNSVGMKWSDQKKAIHTEIMCDTWISLLSAILFSFVYTWCNIYVAQACGHELWSGYWKLWGVIVLGYCGLNYVVTEIVAKYMQWLIHKNQQIGRP